MYNDRSFIERFLDHITETWKNKLCAIGLIALGVLSIHPDGDATALVLTLMFGVPLFFAKKNWIG